jgi:RNA polymerase sigma-70 factor (ECF subfamily)
MQMDHQRDILARVSHGDRAAFGELVQAYQSYAYRLAVRILCDETEAEDVVQETFVRVWRSIDRYNPEFLFTTWLYRIVTNLCLDHLRTRRRNGAVSDRQKSNADAAPDPPSAVDVEKAVSTADLIRIIKTIARDLPETQRLVFTLRDLQDLSIREVQQITGLSEASIKTNLHYARRTLRARMGAEFAIRGMP